MSMYQSDFDDLTRQNQNILNNVKKMCDIKFKDDPEKKKEIMEQTETDLNTHYLRVE